MQQIQNHLQAFTPAQAEIANFVFENREAVAFMTARQLAAAVGQSDAAVVRFARASGFDGYTQLREALRAEVLATHGNSGMQAATAAGSADRDARAVVAEVSSNLIMKTVGRNPPQAFAAVVEALISAKRVYVSGHGTSYPLAAYLSMHLNQCFDKVQIFNMDQGDLAERFRAVRSDVVFIGIGYVRYLPYTIDMMQVAKQLGATVVAITDKHTSPLAKIADHVLIAERSGSSVWWSQAGTFAICDTLISLCIQAEQHTGEHLRLADEMLKKLGHWEADVSSDRPRGLSK
ncbi:MurR/RpiR family transcriptional regulator [Brucella anthropi]|uniref:MurR/RpiR family transcriptional regulator n=1 Tax=Brucella anthropi TaxID=529 RepID=UPI00216630C6|nr:MurR/RpiR family transcriptional regulator [Brucella anthropi]UVV67854.1 MurR/RpiR family transcriptional regulator [Brucella anthropi]